MANPADSRVIYLSCFEYPTTHAHPLHALFMARAFSKLLNSRFLFVIGKEDRVLAGIPHSVPFMRFQSFIHALHMRTFAYGSWLKGFLFIHLFEQPHWNRNLTIFTNDLSVAAVASLSKPFYRFNLVVEVHGRAGKFQTWLALRNATKIIFVSEGLRTELATTTSLAQKSVVLENAVDVERFSSVSTDKDLQQHMRKELGINDNARVIGYIGRFRPMNSDKGVRFMIEALAKLPSETQLLFVGGTVEEIEEEKNYVVSDMVDRITFIPFTDSADLPRYLAACDILAYVPPKPDDFLATETSPMKLYEYMAARRPIIASDLPAFRNVLGEDAGFIPPGDTKAFVEAVEETYSHPEATQKRVAQAFARVSENTWDNRARHVLELL